MKHFLRAALIFIILIVLDIIVIWYFLNPILDALMIFINLGGMVLMAREDALYQFELEDKRWKELMKKYKNKKITEYRKK